MGERGGGQQNLVISEAITFCRPPPSTDLQCNTALYVKNLELILIYE